MRRAILGGVLAAAVLLLGATPAYAMQAFRDDLLSGTTPSAVGTATTAYLNTAQQTLTLPSPPDTVATGLAAGTTVTVLDGPAVNTYQWTGSGLTLNPGLSLSASQVSNPLGVAVVQPGMLAVLTASGVQVYQYTGSGMTQDPTLAWTGVTNPITVSASQGQLAVTTPQDVAIAALTETGWATESTVTPAGTPWDASLAPDGGGLWTISGGSLQEYLQTGSGWGTSPSLAVTGALDPLAAAGDEGQVTAVAGGQVSTYNSTGSAWVQNPLLSIGSGLTQPTAVAVLPGQSSLSVLDGNTLKLFELTASGMAEVSSARITGIQDVYVPSATAESPSYTPATAYAGATLRADLVQNGGWDTGDLAGWTGSGGATVTSSTPVTGPDALDLPSGASASQDVTLTAGDVYLLTAWADVPSGSSLTWGLSGNTQTQSTTQGWSEVGIVSQATASGTVPLAFTCSGTGPCFVDGVSLTDLSNAATSQITVPSGTSIDWAISSDGGSTWNPVPWGGTYQTTTPSSTWQWQATLNTTDPAATPVIHAPVTLLLADPPAAPSPVTMSPVDSQGSVTSLSPTVGWTFPSGGTGWDSQSAYQVVVTDTASGQTVYNSGKVSEFANPSAPPDGSTLTASDPSGAQASMDIPGSVLAGHPQVTVKVRVWDLLDLMSPWASGTFNVFGLGPLAVTKIYNPPSPDPNPALPTAQLPVTALAGAEVDFTIGSTGPVTGITAQFSDGGTATLTPEQAAGSEANTWNGSYYTNGSLATGTTVTVTFTATSSVTGDQVVLTNIPIIVTSGTVYAQYYMILTN